MNLELVAINLENQGQVLSKMVDGILTPHLLKYNMNYRTCLVDVMVGPSRSWDCPQVYGISLYIYFIEI